MPMSYQFHKVPVEAIKVSEERQRKEFKKIDELAASIKRNGLLHPIIIDRENNLVAGERRLRAHKTLGLKEIQVHYLDELDEFEGRAIELEENIKRVDLTWKESCLAAAEYHKIRRDADPSWTQEKTADAIGLSRQHVTRLLQVAEGLGKEDVLIGRAENFESALRVVQRKQKRAIDTEISKIDFGQPMEAPKEAAEKEKDSIIKADFLEWVEGYSGQKFNFLHCDFPYGVKYGKTTYGGSLTWAKYEDGPDVYAALLDCLLTNYERILYKSSHFMFWFSMNYYSETLAAFRDSGFRVNPFPLIWAKNKGLIPDPRREGRRVYETAFFGSIGDRKVITSIPNLVSSPVDKKSHISEKPMPVLEHFFRMFVDEHSDVLDPTCGSGNALAAAKKLGARRYLGLDIEQDYVDGANLLVKRTKANERPSDTRVDTRSDVDAAVSSPDSD